MGLYERGYGRPSERTPWDRIENPRSMTITLIIITVVAFFADLMFLRRDASGSQSVLADWLAVSPESILQPWKIWQTLTYGFLHDTQNIRHILFNMFGLFIFGRIVEQRIGGKEFLRFYLVAIVAGGLAAALYGIGESAVSGASWSAAPSTIGASGAVVAVTVLFACYYPNQEVLLMFIFPIKAWVLACLFVGLDFAGALGFFGPSNTAFQVHLAGAAIAGLYFWRRWDFEFLETLVSSPSRWGDTLRHRSRRMKLKLHDPGRKLANEANEADRILAKIHESGEASLTASERKTLERYSRRQRELRERSS